MHTIVLSIDNLKLMRDSRVIVRVDSFDVAGRHVLPFSSYCLAHTVRAIRKVQ